MKKERSSLRFGPNRPWQGPETRQSATESAGRPAAMPTIQRVHFSEEVDRMSDVYGVISGDALLIRRRSNGRLLAEVDLKLRNGSRPTEVFTDADNLIHVVVVSQFGRPIHALQFDRFGALRRRTALNGGVR